MDVCVRVGGLLLFRFAVAPSSAAAAAAARVVCLHCQPKEGGQRRGSCHPIEAMGRCLSSLLSFKQVGLREPPEQYQRPLVSQPQCSLALPPPSRNVSRVALPVAGNFLR